MVDFITPSSIDIRANDAIASSTAGANGQLFFNTTSNELHVYDGFSIGGYKTSLTINILPPTAYGSVSGYTSGGATYPGGSNSNVIDKFPFASDANATDVGDLTVARDQAGGQSSTVSGYTSGRSTTIDKFPFSTDANATDVGDLTLADSVFGGSSSSTSGYSIFRAGFDKFPFASDANATDVGDLTQARNLSASSGSAESSYTAGGFAPGSVSTIDKFPFSTDANSTGVGNLIRGVYSSSGQSSSISGYISGGIDASFSNAIEKFSFASDGNATDVGDLTTTRYLATGQSSTDSGYLSGGASPQIPTFVTNVIEKFPFASDVNATDVGDLTQGRYDRPAGQQV